MSYVIVAILSGSLGAMLMALIIAGKDNRERTITYDDEGAYNNEELAEAYRKHGTYKISSECDKCFWNNDCNKDYNECPKGERE